MLSSFIRRNGKRKGGKANDSRGHQQSPSTSSNGSPPLVFDIKEESPPRPITQNSPLVELNLFDLNEGWFPKELLRSRSASPVSPSSRAQNDHQNESARESSARASHQGCSHYSRSVSNDVPFRKKSIPAPILIPGAGLLMPNVQIGRSAIPTGAPPPEVSQPDGNPATLSPPSPSTSENLSSVSGTTLARALIGSSFALPACERRGSRRRSGIVRQDSATLPRGDVLFLSNLDGPSSIPPVPPVPERLVNVPSISPPLGSGASTESEYPLSDACTTSPDMVIGSVNPRRVFRVQETPSPTTSSSTKTSPSTIPDSTPQRRANPVPVRSPTVKNGIFDGPKTAVETSLHHGTPFSMNLEGHSLDDFDFVTPEPLVVIASPDSDSGGSYVAPLPKRCGTILRKRRTGGLILNPSDKSLAERYEGYPISAVISEHDYGELLNYDLTVSPESSSSSHGPSSASAGYQTFPETPVVFSPLGSPGYTFHARSDGQLRKRPPSPKLSRLFSSARVVRRPADSNDGLDAAALRRSQSSSLPRPKPLSPKKAESSLCTVVQENEEVGNAGEATSPETSPVEAPDSLKFQMTVRRHPLAHISSSSSCLPEEEALQALAKHSSLFLPSIFVGGDPSPNQTTPGMDLSVQFAVSIPLPDSTDVSPSGSPVSSAGVSAPSPFTSPPHSPFPSSVTAISQSHLLRSSLSAPSPYPGESSFLPSPLSSASLDVSPSRSPSPAPVVSGVYDDLVSHFPSPSYVPPPPYQERTSHHPGINLSSSLLRTPPIDSGYQRGRQASNSSVVSGSRTRGRARPPLPIGPRRPSGPACTFVPGVHDRNGSISSVGSSAGSASSLWNKLQSAASKPSPKFQTPPPKWRGLTLEAAHWTFTSAQLQEIVSHAIQQSSEGSSLRLLTLETLEGEITDEVNCLELQHTDVKAQYKGLVRKRWILMGALAGHIEGVDMCDIQTAARTMEELTEVLLALDHLAARMHEIALQLAQLKSLRDVHNASALAMVVRKINGLFVKQMAEKERLRDQVGALATERDEAWKHAENIAHDYDTLNERVLDVGVHKDAPVCAPVDVQSAASSRRSTRIMAVRKSSVRLSQAGLRSRSKLRPRRSSGTAPRPASLNLENIPPIPSLLANANPLTGSTLDTGISLGSVYSFNSGTEAWELAEAQREVYGMLGLSVPPSQASSRRRTVSDADDPKVPPISSRPVSESLGARVRSWEYRRRRTKSVIFDNCCPATHPLAIAQPGRTITLL